MNAHTMAVVKRPPFFCTNSLLSCRGPVHAAGVSMSLQLRNLPGAWWRCPPVTSVLTCTGKPSSWPESDMESLNTHPGDGKSSRLPSPEQAMGGERQESSDDDLMTPPTVLLEKALEEAKRSTSQKEAEAAVRLWVKCLALTKIVRGNAHWELARCHVQLAKTYFDLRRRAFADKCSQAVYAKQLRLLASHHADLPEQALAHALKGRGILLSPGGHMTSRDQHPQAILSLALTHCIIGRVLTTQGKLSEAEKALQKSRRALERYSSASGGEPVADLELDIISAVGRLCFKQENYGLAKDWFTRAVEQSKAAYGAKHQGLVPLLKELASAELKGGDQGKAVCILEEALEIAETSVGSTSEATGSVLMCLARAHTPNTATAGAAKEYFERACTTYSSLFGVEHERVISCKEELCHHLLTQKENQEEAISLLRDIVQLKKKYYGDHSVQLAHACKWLGAVYLSTNNLELAKDALLKAKAILVSNYGDKHKEVTSVMQTLEVIAGSELGDQTSKSVKERPRFRTVV